MAIPFFQTVQSFAQFLLNWKLSGGKLVDQATADARAAICKPCHNNKPSGEVRKTCCGGNKIASLVLDKARQSILKANATTKDRDILTCAICGCDLKIKVWIPNSVLIKTEDANAYPQFCWLKKILEGKES